MNTTDLSTLIHFNYWANDRVLAACAQISADEFTSSLSADSIHLPYGDDPHRGPQVWQTIVHVVTHGIQHRSEAAALLTGYGHSPGELDFDRFLQEKLEPHGTGL